MHSVYKTGQIAFLFPSAGLLLVWGKERSCQNLRLLSFLTSASVPSLPIPFLSLFTPHLPGQYRVSPLILGVHCSLGPGKRHFPYNPRASLQICCSVPLNLCDCSQKGKQRHRGGVCHTECMHAAAEEGMTGKLRRK